MESAASMLVLVSGLSVQLAPRTVGAIFHLWSEIWPRELACGLDSILWTHANVLPPGVVS